MEETTTKFEELFLKIFKVAILIIMGISLLTTVAFSLVAVLQFLQTPKEPTPAREAPVKDPEQEINLDDLQKYLIEQENKKQESPGTSDAGQEKRQSAKYLEEATALYRCSSDFASNVGVTVNETNEEFLQRVSELRSDLEQKAKNKFRGEKWVRSVVTFSCEALNSKELVTLKKEGKIGKVFYPLIKFHFSAWDSIQNERIKFEKKEKERVLSERSAEESKVAKAKVMAFTCLSTAAGAFGLFMLLALYLIFSKIENNLREMSKSRKSDETEDGEAP